MTSNTKTSREEKQAIVINASVSFDRNHRGEIMDDTQQSQYTWNAARVVLGEERTFSLSSTTLKKIGKMTERNYHSTFWYPTTQRSM